MQQNRINQIVTCYTTLMQALEGRIGDIWCSRGGGLAWLLWQVGGVVDSVVELGSSSVGLVVYRREEGEETVNTMQT